MAHATRTTATASADVAAHVDACLARIDAYDDPAVWIHRFDREQVARQVDRVLSRAGDGVEQPLLGRVFAVKDNIDVAGAPTTAACPAFAYTPARSATVVQRLCDAGAVVVGKTNLDQFATGLVGVRTPYGACRNVFHRDYIAGGSSSGSAVAVAAGLVDFALGTDTAGSGRVPAAFGNIVGLKPTRGLLSTTGVVPACRSLDCVSIFARDCEQAWEVLGVAAAEDAEDPYSRASDEVAPPPQGKPTAGLPWVSGERLRVGVPAPEHLEFFGNTSAASRYEDAVARLKVPGTTVVPFDLTPFLATARLLYQGPWVAERLAAVHDFYRRSPDAFHPITRKIIAGAERLSAVDAFNGLYQLQALRKQAQTVWRDVDAMMLPTTGTIYTLAEVEADPIGTNANLGYYTNFVNLLDLCAVAVPNGFQPNGLPVGVTFIAPAGADALVTRVGRLFHEAVGREGTQ